MFFLVFKNKFDKLLDRKKSELEALNIDSRDIDIYVLISKEYIKKYKKDGIEIVTNKLESLKLLTIVLQKLRKLGYDDDDISYFRKDGVKYINESGLCSLNFEDFESKYSIEMKIPDISKKHILMKRLSPKEYLGKGINELRVLGYTDEDINEFKKNGLKIINENMNKENILTNKYIELEFLIIKEDVEKRKEKIEKVISA